MSLLLLLAAGCVGLRASDTSNARFGSFVSARDAFDGIVPGVTSADELRAERLDPEERGVRLISAIRAASYFTAYPEAPRDLQPPAVRDCVEARARCQVWWVSQERVRAQRVGNLLLDLLGFRRHRNTTGWAFEGLIFLLDDVAVYSIWRGEPSIDQNRHEVRPLGFLQDGPRVESTRLRRPQLILGGVLGEEEK